MRKLRQGEQAQKGPKEYRNGFLEEVVTKMRPFRMSWPGEGWEEEREKQLFHGWKRAS